MSESDPQRFYKRGAIIITSSTLVLTLTFLGVLAVMAGSVSGFSGRVPWYVLVAAAVFAGVILLMEWNETAGRIIIVSAAVSSALSFVVLSLAVEGVLFAIEHPEEVITSQLVLYFVAAGLFGTGLAYWGINHWREFTQRSGTQGRL